MNRMLLHQALCGLILGHKIDGPASRMSYTEGDQVETECSRCHWRIKEWIPRIGGRFV